MLKSIKREHLLSAVCVILRVPSLFIMEAWWRSDPNENVKAASAEKEIIVNVVYYLSMS